MLQLLVINGLLLHGVWARTDPVEGPAGIAGVPNMVVTGDLGQPLNIRCLAYGYPTPQIYWYRGNNGPMVPYSNALYETRGNILQIRRLNSETLGEYLCQAYNGRGKAAAWPLVVQARSLGGDDDRPHTTSRDMEVNVTPRPVQTEASTPPAPEIRLPVYTGFYLPPTCKDNPYFAYCNLIVRSKFCYHKYYSNFCCKSCVEAGLLNPIDIGLQADQPWYKRK